MFSWPFAHELWRDQDHRVLLPSKLPHQLPGKKGSIIQVYIFNYNNIRKKILQKKYISTVSRRRIVQKDGGGGSSNMAGIIYPLGPKRVNWYPSGVSDQCPCSNFCSNQIISMKDKIYYRNNHQIVSRNLSLVPLLNPELP